MCVVCFAREAKQSKARKGEARRGEARQSMARNGIGWRSVGHSFIQPYASSIVGRHMNMDGWAAGSICIALNFASHCIGIIGYWQLDGTAAVHVKYTEDGKRREKWQEIMD